MDRSNKLPSFNVAFGGLIGLLYPDDTTAPQLHYQGMSVQTLNSPFSVYFSQSNTGQNHAHSINPLNEFRVASLTQSVPNGFDGLDLPVTSESILDEYVPCNADNESVDDALLPVLSSSPFNQACLSGNEPEIREPTPANLSNPDYHLTNLPAELSNSQDSRPVAIVNSLNLQKATNDNPSSSAEINGDKSSQAEHKRDRRKVPAYLERKRKHDRERKRDLRKDPAYLERERKRDRERERDHRKDPAYLERKRKRDRERKRDHRKDPAYVERERERDRERKRERCQNDPVYAEGKEFLLKFTVE